MGIQLAEQRIEQILATAPDRDFAAQRCIDAWNDLSTERPMHSLGMAGGMLGAIPWSSMVAWCDFHGLDYESAALLIDVLRKLDVDRAARETAELAQKQRDAARRGRR